MLKNSLKMNRKREETSTNLVWDPFRSILAKLSFQKIFVGRPTLHENSFWVVLQSRPPYNCGYTVVAIMSQQRLPAKCLKNLLR